MGQKETQKVTRFRLLVAASIAVGLVILFSILQVHLRRAQLSADDACIRAGAGACQLASLTGGIFLDENDFPTFPQEETIFYLSDGGAVTPELDDAYELRRSHPGCLAAEGFEHKAGNLVTITCTPTRNARSWDLVSLDPQEKEGPAKS